MSNWSLRRRFCERRHAAEFSKSTINPSHRMCLFISRLPVQIIRIYKKYIILWPSLDLLKIGLDLSRNQGIQTAKGGKAVVGLGIRKAVAATAVTWQARGAQRIRHARDANMARWLTMNPCYLSHHSGCPTGIRYNGWWLSGNESTFFTLSSMNAPIGTAPRSSATACSSRFCAAWPASRCT